MYFNTYKYNCPYKLTSNFFIISIKFHFLVVADEVIRLESYLTKLGLDWLLKKLNLSWVSN